jgi:hypothetical protein
MKEDCKGKSPLGPQTCEDKKSIHDLNSQKNQQFDYDINSLFNNELGFTKVI